MAKNKDINIKEVFITGAVTAFASALAIVLAQAILPKTKPQGMGRPSALLFNLSLERQAQFADIVTISKVNDLKWFR